MRIRIIRSAARDFRPLTPSELERHRSDWLSFASPGTEIEVVRVTRGPATIESLYDADFAAPFVLKEVERAAREEVDAILIACMLDPALFASRELVNIPVVGEGQACFVTAVALGSRFSVISPAPNPDMQYRSRLRMYGLETHLASVRSLNMPVLELRRNLDRLKSVFLEQGRQAVEQDGADVIVPGCGQIWGLSQELSAELGVPVLDPRATALRLAEMFVSLSLSQSKMVFPYPPQKRREL
jgi:allantoin racemase